MPFPLSCGHLPPYCMSHVDSRLLRAVPCNRTRGSALPSLQKVMLQNQWRTWGLWRPRQEWSEVPGHYFWEAQEQMCTRNDGWSQVAGASTVSSQMVGTPIASPIPNAPGARSQKCLGPYRCSRHCMQPGSGTPVTSPLGMRTCTHNMCPSCYCGCLQAAVTS